VIGGHGPGTQIRLSQVKEVLSAADGTFVIPAWSEAARINLGPVCCGSPAVTAFLPGYEPQALHEEEMALSQPYSPGNEIKLYRYGAKPPYSTTAYKQPTLENLRRFNAWIDGHVFWADDPGSPNESWKRKAAMDAQQTAKAMVVQELRRLAGSPR
jgi:hypothetical protein